MKYTRIYLLVLMLLGLALRLDLLIASNWVIDGDEAIVGLMAQHLATGKASSIPVFYYGQNYMGSLEPLMVAVLFWLTGDTASSVLLKLVPLTWSIALIPLGYLLACSMFGAGERSTQRLPSFKEKPDFSRDLCGLAAAAYLALPPAPLMIWSTMARGGFIEVVVMATLALLLAIKWQERRPLTLTASIGLVLGLGWWTNNQIIYALLPIGLWMLVNIWRSVAWPLLPLTIQLLIGLAAFILGGLPFWWFNLTNDFISFEMFGGATGNKLWPQVGELFTVALPIIFGAKRFWHLGDVFWGSTFLAWSAITVVLLIGAFSTRFSFLKFKTARDLVLLYAVTTCAVFTFSSFGWLTSAPRYLLPLYPAIAVIFGLVISNIARISAVVPILLLISVLGFNLCSVYLGGRALPGQPVVANGERVAQSNSKLIAWLTNNNISMVEANYWIGYRLAFETNEAVRFRVFGEPAVVRIPAYEEIADDSLLSTIPLILMPSQLTSVSNALSELGFTFETERVGSYEIIKNRVSKIASFKEIAVQRFSSEASQHPEFTAAAFDNDSSTRWGSGAPQRPGMSFTVTFKAPVHLRGIRLDWRSFPPDYPRGLEIIAVTENKWPENKLAQKQNAVNQMPVINEVQLMSGEQYRKAQPLSTKISELSVFADTENVTAIILRQLGSDRKFDWSIAEVKLYE